MTIIKEPICQGMDDDDLYKVSTGMAAIAHQPGVEVVFEFKDRRPEGKYTPAFKSALDEQIRHMGTLRTPPEMIEHLRTNCPWLRHDYLEWLRNFRFCPDQVETRVQDGQLKMRIQGPHESASRWEMPLMYTVSELYFRLIDTDWSKAGQLERIHEKAKALDEAGVYYSDFGTRRRRDFWTQDRVVEIMSQYPHFQGTSNMLLARKHGCKVRGTFPHEWPQRISALESLRHANRYAMRIWQKIFGARLGIALPDTFGTTSFLRDFDDTLARLFDGVRHDSGEPVEFALRIVAHYEKLGIDPTTKVIVFSDSLNIKKVLEIEAALKNRIRRSYGIGTFLTNDYPGSPALNMVIKMTMCDGIHVVKLSDSPTKAIGDYDALRVAAYTHLGIPLDSGMYDHVRVAA